MYVKGLTLAEVVDLIQKTLNEYFKECTVNVKLVNFDVAVIGEVNSPGNFTVYRDQLNIFQAIGLAGGLKEFGNPKRVKLIRQTQTGSNMFEIDLTDNKILSSSNFYLMPNDIIYVEPLNSKSTAYRTFPYSLILVSLSTLLVGANLYLTHFYEK